MKRSSRILACFSAILLLATFKFPFWVIYLIAPQYPEGLEMFIWLHKVSGDVETINGLNHYIGMSIIDENTFVEFKVLPYIISFFILSGLLIGILGRRTLFMIWTATLMLFSFLAVYDFWHWEYAYGHHLDPDAPIKIENMSYQPPLIGYKKLLNFEAYSYPHGGGWFYISSVSIALLTAGIELKHKAHKKKVHV